MGKWYKKESKIECVRLASEPDNTQAKVERDLGLSQHLRKITYGRKDVPGFKTQQKGVEDVLQKGSCRIQDDVGWSAAQNVGVG